MFADRIDPRKTVLFMGAGSSRPSGAPTGSELAQQLFTRLGTGQEASEDLAEAASILENRLGRNKLITEIRSILEPLKPTGGLLALPEFEWPTLYTTNFDLLLEKAYAACGKELAVIGSNFDYWKAEMVGTTLLFKIHGTITQDLIDGHRARIVVTESDLEEYAKYRSVLFSRLSLDLAAKDVLLIGASLKDPHLKRELAEAAKLHRDQGAPGRLFALIFEADPDRGRLWEDRGFEVAFGGIDDFLQYLADSKPATAPAEEGSRPEMLLPTRLRACTTDVQHATTFPSQPVRLYNGSSATYADVSHNLTFRRAIEKQLLAAIDEGEVRYVTITGVAGVGKTTLARRMLVDLSSRGFLAWEHRSDFPFQSEEWISVEKALRKQKRRGVVLVDDCPEFLRQINLLVEYMKEVELPALNIILTATNSQWVPRTKSSELFANGRVEKLSLLTTAEIDNLLRVVDKQPRIQELVDRSFARLTRPQKRRHLQNKCSADMYVCLKHVFASDDIDNILLREYASLDEDLQDVYRHVAALEAAGTRVHRQLILRTLNIEADSIAQLLDVLEGLVDEYDIKASDGLFGWQTRHEVIAQTIARYKFADQQELYALLERVITGLNPSIWVELRTLRDLCGFEYGIGRLTDPLRRLVLYEQMIELAPAERIPRHRQISTLLQIEELDQARQAIKAAEGTVRLDSPINRYKVRLAIRRAETTTGILDEDRVAILREAESLALKGIQMLSTDKWAYFAYCDVGQALARLTGDTQMFDEALMKLEEAEGRILDPQVGDKLQQYGRTLRRLSQV